METQLLLDEFKNVGQKLVGDERDIFLQERAQALNRLTTKFDIKSEFVRVPVLSKILSMSSNAIYAQMRNGSFPIAHKKVGNVVLVRVIDFVDWYCTHETRHELSEVCPASPHPLPLTDFESNRSETAIPAHSKILREAETPKERSERIKNEVIAAIKSRHIFVGKE